MENNMCKNLEIYNAVRKVPQEAQKPIAGGRLKGKTDINPMWRIKTLTEQFGVVGFGWYTEIISQWIEKGAAGEAAAFCNINLYIRQGEEWSKPIFGTGGAMFVEGEKNGLRTEDEAFKKAYTDAISVACKAIGIGADVYWSSDRTKYDAPPTQPKAQAQGQKKAQVAQPTTPPQPSAPTSCNSPAIEDDMDLVVALDEVKRAQSVDGLKEVWERWKPTYALNNRFVHEVNVRKKELSSNIEKI